MVCITNEIITNTFWQHLTVEQALNQMAAAHDDCLWTELCQFAFSSDARVSNTLHHIPLLVLPPFSFRLYFPLLISHSTLSCLPWTQMMSTAAGHPLPHQVQLPAKHNSLPPTLDAALSLCRRHAVKVCQCNSQTRVPTLPGPLHKSVVPVTCPNLLSRAPEMSS